ncbi:hypothetical protein [uncultured Ornithinimicrobium sp.]|uniref:hypothetical protein n=1 Tax=uncultured Ornithinimicrobium sp. TaxID=259307 RepID=UPI002597783D|nr:hypothetical protein [uncultured Ornithinimicrobium sp.]
MATTPAGRAPRSTSEGTITTSGLVWGLLLGLPAGFALQLVLGIALGPLVERWAVVAYLDFLSPVPAGAIAVVVVLVPRLRETGSGFLLGLTLGMVAEALLLWWWISSTFGS